MSAGLIAITKGASVAGSGTLGANQIPYANSAGELQGSSALTFDGAVLTAQGSVRAYSNLFVYGESGDRLNITPQAAGSGVLAVITNNANTDYAPLVLDSSRHVFNLFGGEVMRLTSTGLGIGTSSPGAKLQVGDAGSAAPVKILVRSASADTYLQSTSTGSVIGTPNGVPLLFNTNDAERMRIDSAGNLGLGVTPYGWGASARCIDLVGNVGFASLGNSDAFVLSNAYYDGSTWRYKSSSIAVSVYRAAIGAHTWFTAPSGTAGNAITLTQAMTLDASGNLGIGTSSPGAKLDVVGAGVFKLDGSGSTTPLILRNNNTTSTQVVKLGFDSNGEIKASINAAVYGNDYMTFNVGSDTERMRLDASGNLRPGTDNSQTLGSGSYRWSVVYAGTGTINTSDAREKTKVSLLEDKEIEAAAALSAEIGKFQFLSSIESKGEDKARIHLGMTVQRAIEIMEKNSLDPMRYAFICYDKWEEEVDAVEGEEGAYAIISSTQKTATSQVEEKVIEVIDGVPTQKTVTKDVASPVYEAVPVVDEDGNPVVNITPAIEEELDEEGNVVKEAIPEQVVPATYQVPVMETVTTWKKKVSKDRYGFRYDQLIMFIAKGLEARFTRAIQGLVG